MYTKSPCLNKKKRTKAPKNSGKTPPEACYLSDGNTKGIGRVVRLCWWSVSDAGAQSACGSPIPVVWRGADSSLL